MIDVHHIAFVLDHSRLVVVHIQITRCGENRHDGETQSVVLVLSYTFGSLDGSCNENALSKN